MDYKDKYLKYKKKYLSLKKIEQHGGYKWKELKPKSNLKLKKFEISLENFYQLKVIKPKDVKNLLINNSNNFTSIFKILFNKIIPEIKKNKINFFIVPLPLSDDNKYWTDYYNSYLKSFYDDNWNEYSFVFLTIRLHNNLKINFKEKMILSHGLSLKERQIVFDIFSKYLPNNYSWSGKTTEAMIISYEKSKNKIKKIKIKETKIYPSGRISMEASFENDSKFIKEFVDNKPESYNIDPYDKFLNFSKIFKEIEKKSDIFDAVWNWNLIARKIYINFDIKNLRNLNLLVKLSELKYFTYKKYKFKITSNLKDHYIFLSEDEEIQIRDINKKSSPVKKKERPSPSESATKFKVGTKKKGNDGNMWIIVENKNGVKRWNKVK